MALLVILSAALYGTYFSVLNGQERATAGIEERRELRGTLDRLRRELAATFYRRGDKRLPFVVEDRDIFGKPASTLSFVTFAPPRSDDLRVSDQIAVAYRVEEKEGKLILLRGAKDSFVAGDPVFYPQMEGIEGFQVECYDGGKWVKSWDTTLNAVLPKMVRVTLRVKDGDQTVEFTATIVPQVSR